MKSILKKNYIKALIVLLVVVISFILLKQFSHITIDAGVYVAETFDSLKKLENEAIKTYTTMEKYIDSEDGKGLFKDEEVMKNALFENFDYDIISAQEINDEMYNATVMVKNIDMRTLAENYSEKVKEYIVANPSVSNEELDKKTKELFLKEFLNPKLDLIETEITVRLEKDGDNWVVIPSSEIEDAVTGGLMGIIDKSRKQEEEKVVKKEEIDLFFEIVENEDEAQNEVNQ